MIRVVCFFRWAVDAFHNVGGPDLVLHFHRTIDDGGTLLDIFLEPIHALSCGVLRRYEIKEAARIANKCSDFIDKIPYPHGRYLDAIASLLTFAAVIPGRFLSQGFGYRSICAIREPIHNAPIVLAHRTWEGFGERT